MVELDLERRRPEGRESIRPAPILLLEGLDQAASLEPGERAAGLIRGH